MGSPVRPEPDNWLLDDLRNRVQPEPRQLGPRSPFAPADASAVRQRPVPKTLRDYGHTARQIVGGIAEGVARLPSDVAGLLALPVTAGPEQGSLRTVGRGEVRPSSEPSMGSVVRPQVEGLLAAGEHVASRVGDAVAGGAPQNISDESFRDIGSVVGNIAGWEAGVRLPKIIRGIRNGRAAEAGLLPVPEVADTRRIVDAHPLEHPPEGLSHEELQAWRRRLVNRRMGKPEGTGEARGYANASGQEMLDNHLRRLGLLPGEATYAPPPLAAAAASATPAPARGGLLDALPSLDESGRIGVAHGSPHKFPPEPGHPLGRFDISKIGTGEGAQAYGHGLYFAGDENVAKYYRAKETGTLFPPKPHQFTLGDVSYERRGDRFLRGNGEELTKKEYGAAFRDAQAAYADAVANRGALYRAEIDAEPEHFLDWDKPLSEQSAYVRERLAKLDPDMYAQTGNDFDPQELGQMVYQRLVANLGDPQAASAALRDAGIPGNRYLDGASRGKGAGSHNYVVFDDKPLKIVGREGHGALPVLGALGLLSGGALTAAAKMGLLDQP